MQTIAISNARRFDVIAVRDEDDAARALHPSAARAAHAGARIVVVLDLDLLRPSDLGQRLAHGVGRGLGEDVDVRAGARQGNPCWWRRVVPRFECRLSTESRRSLQSALRPFVPLNRLWLAGRPLE